MKLCHGYGLVYCLVILIGALFHLSLAFFISSTFIHHRNNGLQSNHRLPAVMTASVDSDHWQEYLSRFRNVAKLYVAPTNAAGTDALLHRLMATHVCIVGIGGVGSWVGEALARSGVGKFTLFDVDDVCVSNVNRQLVALSATVGQFKAQVLRERILAINPHAEVNVKLEFIRPFNALTALTNAQDGSIDELDQNDLFSLNNFQKQLAYTHCDGYSPKYDFVIDAADGVSDKAAILDVCSISGTPVITSGGVGGLVDPTQLRVSDLVDVHGDRLLALVRKKLRKEYGYPKTSHTEKKKVKKWNIQAVHALPSVVHRDLTVPSCSSNNEQQDSNNSDNKALNGFRKCDSTLGSACFATGTAGFVIASVVVNAVAVNKPLLPKFRGRLIHRSGHTSSDHHSDKDPHTSKSTPERGGGNCPESNHEESCNCASYTSAMCSPSSGSPPITQRLDRIFSEQGLDAITHPLIDAHCHLQLDPLFNQHEECMSMMATKNIELLSICGTSPGADWQRISTLHQLYPGRILPSFGLHPWWISRILVNESSGSEFPWDVQLEELLRQNPQAGVGECGLDKAVKGEVSVDSQIGILKRHVELARVYQRVLTIHCVGCWGNLLQVLQQEDKAKHSPSLPSVILHSCNSMPLEMLGNFTKLKIPVFFSLCSRMSDKAWNLAQNIPRDRLLLETDAPDQLAVAFKDELAHNHPALVKYHCVKVAERLVMDANELAQVLYANTRRALLL